LAWNSCHGNPFVANYFRISKIHKPKTKNIMNRILQHIPELEGDEYMWVERLTEQMDENQLRQFAGIYRSRRRDPQNVMIFSVIGLVFLPGLQRFYLGQIGMGILYLFTVGLCFIGSILDLVNYKAKAFEYNQRVADECVRMV
jgi:TM2 domain-containing membrane protein YozV